MSKHHLTIECQTGHVSMMPMSASMNLSFSCSKTPNKTQRKALRCYFSAFCVSRLVKKVHIARVRSRAASGASGAYRLRLTSTKKRIMKSFIINACIACICSIIRCDWCVCIMSCPKFTIHKSVEYIVVLLRVFVCLRGGAQRAKRANDDAGDSAAVGIVSMSRR